MDQNERNVTQQKITVTAIFDGHGEVAKTDEQDLADLLSHEHVITLDLAAQIMNREPERLLDAARRATAHCLVLEGPPIALLDVAGIAAEVEAAE